MLNFDKDWLIQKFRENEVVFVFILIVMTLLWIVFFSESQKTYQDERTFRYSFTLQNRTNTALKDIDFYTYAPLPKTSSQVLKSLSASHQFKSIDDKLGNRVLHFKIDHLSPYESKVIKIESVLLLSRNPVFQEVENEKDYLVSEKYVEVNHPTVWATASNLNIGNDFKTAKSVMDWVNRNIKYAGYIEDNRGALYALKARKGDCTEYMYLYTALMRSQGIPVRNMGGYVYSESKVLNPEDFHNWSEVYLDGKWQVVDPQNGVFMVKQSNYIAFRVISDAQNSKYSPLSTQRVAISNQHISVKMQ